MHVFMYACMFACLHVCQHVQMCVCMFDQTIHARTRCRHKPLQARPPSPPRTQGQRRQPFRILLLPQRLAACYVHAYASIYMSISIYLSTSLSISIYLYIDIHSYIDGYYMYAHEPSCTHTHTRSKADEQVKHCQRVLVGGALLC